MSGPGDHANALAGPSPPASRARPTWRRAVIATVLGLVRTTVVLALLGGGVYAAYWFNTNEQRAARSDEAREEASRLVETVTAERTDHRVRVVAMGAAAPAREAVLRPRVGGMIIEQAEAFVPGGFFEAGEVMLRLDRADYEQALLQRESELAQAEADLQVELGDQAVAREELELLQVDIPEINRDLILRIPQVNRARAEVRSAEARVERARLDLERTEMTAPFAGHIVDRRVNLGANVSPGDELATLVGDERYWIEVATPVANLRWIELPASPGEPGSPAIVRHRRAWGDGASRRGEVTQLVGRLEPGSRMARLIVSVPDPLARDPERHSGPELLLGAFVEVEIEGRRLEDVVMVDRSLIREGDVIWVMGDDDRLVTKPVVIAHRGREHAYITAGVDHGDRMVRTNLQTPVDGMLLREAGPAAPEGALAGARRGAPDG